MTKDQAKEAYRQAWMGWCLATTQESKRMFEQRMDGLQTSITRGPGPEWQAFAESLPGFVKFWEGWREETVERIISE